MALTEIQLTAFLEQWSDYVKEKQSLGMSVAIAEIAAIPEVPAELIEGEGGKPDVIIPKQEAKAGVDAVASKPNALTDDAKNLFGSVVAVLIDFLSEHPEYILNAANLTLGDVEVASLKIAGVEYPVATTTAGDG